MSQSSPTPRSVESEVAECGQVLLVMVRALVDHPDEVSVDAVSGAQAVIFEVSVDPEDVRRVIGRKGRTADALRELMTNLGSKAGRRFLVEIVEPKNRAQPGSATLRPQS